MTPRYATNPHLNPAVAVELTLRERLYLMSHEDWQDMALRQRPARWTGVTV